MLHSLLQATICVSLVTLALTAFLLAYSSRINFGDARGIVAGLAFRTGLFLALCLPEVAQGSVKGFLRGLRLP
jgi:hypothetical protein